MAQELEYSDLNLLCLHSHHLDFFQMQQSDLELGILQIAPDIFFDFRMVTANEKFTKDY